MIDARTAPYGLFLLRVTLGVMFVAHALMKYFLFTIPGFAGFLGKVGFPEFMAWPVFLAEQLPVYLQEKGLDYVAQIEPDDFTRWVFPRLFHSRLPRYESIAGPHGYTVTSQEVAQVRDEQDFLALVEAAIGRKGAA